LGLAFFLSEHDWTKSRLENFALSDQDMAASVEGGAANRQVAFLAVGGLGLVLLGNTTFLALGQGRTLSFRNSAAVLALGYAAWCVASVAWSVETALTAKRLAVLILCLVGVLGVCRHLGGRDLCTLALLLTSGFALIGIAAELSLGTFRPWAGDYRFGGTVHPNAQGVYCRRRRRAAAADQVARSAGRTGRRPGGLVAGAGVGGEQTSHGRRGDPSCVEPSLGGQPAGGRRHQRDCRCGAAGTQRRCGIVQRSRSLVG
jgi:hypothetical protein